jgi:hypothetical protein
LPLRAPLRLRLDKVMGGGDHQMTDFTAKATITCQKAAPQ